MHTATAKKPVHTVRPDGRVGHSFFKVDGVWTCKQCGSTRDKHGKPSVATATATA